MTEETKTEETQEVLQVTAGDLALMVKIIDAGSERGAWKGEELGTIGSIRTKMVQIVQSVAPVEDTVADGEEAEEATEEVAEVVEVEEAPVAEAKPKRKRAAKPTAA